MTDAIYVVGDDGSLSPVPRTPFSLEDDLQKLIAEHPELLPGDQINPESPRRWRLIRREAGVGTATQNNRFSLDHLFVDQDAIPTLVEAKKGGNPEARREVVAQLLEYAANGTLYWPIDELRSWFEEQHASDGAAQSIAELIGADASDEQFYEDFWRDFEANLRDRRIRLIFVADAIPSELRTLVEFLNEQMERVEVLAVEVTQYATDGRQMLKPQLVGQTAKARALDKAPLHRKWLKSVDEFLAKVPDGIRPRIEALTKLWSQLEDATVTHDAATSIQLNLRNPTKKSGRTTVFTVTTVGDVWFNRGYVIDGPTFADDTGAAGLDESVAATIGSVSYGAKLYFGRVNEVDPNRIETFGRWLSERFLLAISEASQ